MVGRVTTLEKDTKKWKNALLKTGLPLEFDVGSILEKYELYISGEFSYTRKNENGMDTEFSVDLLAEDFVTRGRHTWAHISHLIECKYTYPTVSWVFTNHPEYSINSYGPVTVFNSLCPWLLVNGSTYEPFRGMSICIKGVELHESDANSHNVFRGLNQLRWAMPQLAVDLIKDQIEARDDEDLFSEFVCPILVTTAPLYVLKPNINLMGIERAKNLAEIATRVDSLVCYQKAGTQLRRYRTDLVASQLQSTPAIAERLNSLWALKNSVRPEFGTYTSNLANSFERITENVLVVNISAFERTIKAIRQSVRKSGVGLRRIARIVPSRSFQSVIEPLNRKEPGRKKAR